ncbi:hypothetical protein BGZ60DRAFT_275415 [Tricladium varicosporioides]|nr:hypothetical protein BGZ60DRAFT_275415 [Hymenoscyphus varicosporioides]
MNWFLVALRVLHHGDAWKPCHRLPPSELDLKVLKVDKVLQARGCRISHKCIVGTNDDSGNPSPQFSSLTSRLTSNPQKWRKISIRPN